VSCKERDDARKSADESAARVKVLEGALRKAMAFPVPYDHGVRGAAYWHRKPHEQPCVGCDLESALAHAAPAIDPAPGRVRDLSRYTTNINPDGAVEVVAKDAPPAETSAPTVEDRLWTKAPCKGGCGEILEDEGPVDDDWWCSGCWPYEERKRLRQERDRLRAEMADARASLAQVRHDRDEMIAVHDEVERERDRLATSLEPLQRNLDEKRRALQDEQRAHDATRARLGRAVATLRMAEDHIDNSTHDKRACAEGGCAVCETVRAMDDVFADDESREAGEYVRGLEAVYEAALRVGSVHFAGEDAAAAWSALDSALAKVDARRGQGGGR
jgi:hypothetical protein